MVGVSENETNLGRGIVRNMLEAGYTGKIYPVGPRGGEVYGLPIYSHLRDLPEPVDLAAVLTPARFVPQVVADCGELGITRVVVESGGFSELGEQGRALEQEIVRLINRYHLRLIGPNGLGLMNMEIGLSLPFSQIVPVPKPGKISVIAQSGGVGMHVIAWMTKEGLGLNKFLSLGNKLNVKENEALAYFLEDPGTKMIYLYLEGLEDGRELLEVAKHAAKPIFLQMPNVVQETSRIAMSHTASLATDEKAVDAACRQGNIFRVLRQSDFLNAAKMVGHPPVKGNRLVILSRSGGEAVVGAYACKRYGFSLPPLAPGLADFILESSRAQIIKPGNPIDLGDIFDFEVYSRVMDNLCQDPEVDAVLLNYGPVYDPDAPRPGAWPNILSKKPKKPGNLWPSAFAPPWRRRIFSGTSLRCRCFISPGTRCGPWPTAGTSPGAAPRMTRPRRRLALMTMLWHSSWTAPAAAASCPCPRPCPALRLQASRWPGGRLQATPSRRCLPPPAWGFPWC